MSKRTWQTKKVKRLRKHGFLSRMSTPGGKNVIKARRKKGRKRLTVTTGTKQRLNNSFPKEARLLSEGDFGRLKQNPSFVNSGLFLFFHLPRPSGDSLTRIGISVSKKISKRAVDRNLLKRRIREIFRTSEFKNCNRDINIVLNRKKFKGMEYALNQLEKDLLVGLQKVCNQ